ncbi:come operon protein 3 [Bacillus sp. UMTAT18]|uniref:aldolase n=1 Tax=Bacillus TaxID=1386 RepID=UPI0006186942|nr:MULTISPECIES: aldolase [unclassified Bacillus (in: firmicutes)]KKC53272.1 come operon protein 3 [Bacillus sp. UMTAT18]MDU2393623.1 aldolase [Bacillus sp. (in: firmicutes)]OJD78779.1 aldolase [Bacillus sp. P14-1]
MKLYCEKVNFNNKLKTYDIILDFNSMADLEKVAQLLEVQISRESSKTLLHFQKMKFEAYKGPRAGSWYDIPACIFEEFRILNEEEGRENRLIRFYLEQKSTAKLNFQQFLTTKEIIREIEMIEKFTESKLYKDMKKKEKFGNLELIVKDVGCGNWNEIVERRRCYCDGDLKCEFFDWFFRYSMFRLIYDLGGDIKFSNEEMNEILNKVNIDRPYYAVISHWDLDHYRGILDLNDVELKLMKNLVAPSKIPNTLQANKALNRLKSLGIRIDIIKPSPKTGRRIDLISQGKINNFELFRSTDGSNINQSGIVLSVEGNDSIGLLTGDHSYRQIYKVISNSKIEKPYVMVVPHHGGNAGKFDEALWSTVSLASGCISTKSARYTNLPQNKIHNFFMNQKSFHCTECHKRDYEQML